MFDATDQRILEILQRDADYPVARIAEEVGLSKTPCWRRIRRLEELGVLRRRVALVDHAKANLPMTVFIGVKAPRHEVQWLDAFKALVEETEEIVEAYRLTGRTDYILKIVVPDIARYDLVYKRMIARLEFSEVNSSIAMEEMKFTTAVPVKYLATGGGEEG
ncbi:Lrp/AsnC family transcriptional regulator [Oceanicella sp. SM1341]|uniref:Lrp/AsnC family transcriptional regulator n=1 Tax=Oceanicella sp. SM1341 TaxID=1548889 RepID=UPI000E5073C0|nr:Lrp/AsnC family transcriptional regulator [Oceanicella sp. SM1341]